MEEDNFAPEECSGKNNHRHLDQYKGQGEILNIQKTNWISILDLENIIEELGKEIPSSTVDSKYLYKIWEEQKVYVLIQE